MVMDQEALEKQNKKLDTIGRFLHSPHTCTKLQQYFLEALPKDYDAFATDDPGKGFRSTYNHLGTYPTGPDDYITDNEKKQIEALTTKERQYYKKPMVNFLTYPTTLGQERQKHWAKSGILPLPDDYGQTDYISCMKNDYTIFYPLQSKELSFEEIYAPETKFRRLLVEGNSPRRQGMNTFYDENMDYLQAKKRTNVDPPPFALHY